MGGTRLHTLFAQPLLLLLLLPCCCAPAPAIQVARYALAMHGVASEAAKERAGAAGRDFRAEVATAAARAMGARYKPEIAAAVKAMPKRTADGLAVDMAIDALKVR